MNVLIVSSRPPEYSGNLGNDLCKAFTATGNKVTWAYDDIFKQYQKIDAYLCNIRNKEANKDFLDILVAKLKAITQRVCGKKTGKYFLVEDESRPVFPVSFNTNKIKGNFDLILVLFTSDMISVLTVEELSKKYKCPVFLYGIDMYFLTGGCHFFDNCKQFYNECKWCPAKVFWKKNVPHKNFLLKKQVFAYNDIRLLTNSHCKRYALTNGIAKENKLVNMSYILDETLFVPKDRFECRERLGIPQNANFVMLARYSSHERKGFVYIRESINQIFGKIEHEFRDRIVLCLIGEDATNIIEQIPIKTLNFGKVSIDVLIDLYNSADVFLSGSIDDAGPSMVNQAMACGTPVVSFNIGTAIDVLKNNVSGFKSNEISVEGFANCLNKIYRLKENERVSLRHTTRQVAIDNNSLGAFVKIIENELNS